MSNTLKGSRGAIKGSNPHNTFDAIAPGASQTVSVAGTHAESSAFQSNTSIVRLYSTTNCWIAFGSAPVADNTGMYLLAGIVEYFAVTGGNKVSALQDTASGTLYITEGLS